MRVGERIRGAVQFAGQRVQHLGRLAAPHDQIAAQSPVAVAQGAGVFQEPRLAARGQVGPIKDSGVEDDQGQDACPHVASLLRGGVQGGMVVGAQLAAVPNKVHGRGCSFQRDESVLSDVNRSKGVCRGRETAGK